MTEVDYLVGCRAFLIKPVHKLVLESRFVVPAAFFKLCKMRVGQALVQQSVQSVQSQQ